MREVLVVILCFVIPILGIFICGVKVAMEVNGGYI